MTNGLFTPFQTVIDRFLDRSRSNDRYVNRIHNPFNNSHTHTHLCTFHLAVCAMEEVHVSHVYLHKVHAA